MSLAAHFRRHGNTWLFVLGFILLCSVYEYGRVMNMRPFPHHLSRQTAGLSFAYTYWDRGNALLDPQVQHLLADDLTSGRTVAEFPILYWAIGQLWRLTGPSEFAYRVLMLLLHFGASWALYGLLRRFIGHSAWAALAALLFFTSPAVVYFAIGFLPDVPAFGLVLIGTYVLFRRWPDQSRMEVILAAAIFGLAALLKISALMVPLTLLVLLAGERVWPLRPARLFQHPRTTLVAILAVLGVVAWWYGHWVETYLRHHGRMTFSHSGTWALWDLPQAEAQRAWQAGKDVTVWQIFDTPAWLAFAGMLIFLLWYAKQVPRLAWLALITLSVGIVLYVLLWFITLSGHEYYFIHTLVLPILLTALFLRTVARVRPAWSPVMLTVLALLVSYHALYAANNHRIRTRSNGPFVADDFLPLYHPGEAAYWDMVQYWGMEAMPRIEAYNRGLGIQPDDRVFCVSDPTVCGSLYLMRRSGWTGFGMDIHDPAQWDARIRAGAQYLFVEERNHLHEEPGLAPYFRHPIGAFEGTAIFDLRPLHP